MPLVHDNPVIRGEKVWLRPMEREDIEPSIEMLNDREISELVGFWGPVGKTMSERWFDEEVLKKHGEREFYFVICQLGSADLIGQCGLHDVLRGVRADVGIWLHRDQLGRGYGTDAMNALMDYGFSELGLERLGLHVSPGNDRAIRSYEKAGFSHEGRLRSYRRRQGGVMDDLVMSIVRREWEALDRPKSWELPAPRRPARRRTTRTPSKSTSRSAR